MQVDSIKIRIETKPKFQRLQLKYAKLLSSFAFKFNLRRYNMVSLVEGNEHDPTGKASVQGVVMVGRCTLTLSNPRCKRLELSS